MDFTPQSMFPEDYPPGETIRVTVREHTRRIKGPGVQAPKGTAEWLEWTNTRCPGLTISQGKVMWLMLHTDHPVTDDDLVAMARTFQVHISDSGLRSRRHELVALGHIRPAGESRTQAHRRTTLWKLP